MKKVSHNKAQAREIFKSIDWDVGVLEITVKPFKAKRSHAQKGLFYAWIDEITEHLNKARINISQRKVKELVCHAFGPKEEVLGYNIRVSTEDYIWDEMHDMLMEIQVWAATDLNLELRVKGELERAKGS